MVASQSFRPSTIQQQDYGVDDEQIALNLSGVNQTVRNYNPDEQVFLEIHRSGP
jgi:hypothetical protein